LWRPISEENKDWADRMGTNENPGLGGRDCEPEETELGLMRESLPDGLPSPAQGWRDQLGAGPNSAVTWQGMCGGGGVGVWGLRWGSRH
jgi:hypothetical protein